MKRKMEKSNIIVHFLPKPVTFEESFKKPSKVYEGVCEYQFTGNFVVVFHDTTERDIFPLAEVESIHYDYNV